MHTLHSFSEEAVLGTGEQRHLLSSGRVGCGIPHHRCLLRGVASSSRQGHSLDQEEAIASRSNLARQLARSCSARARGAASAREGAASAREGTASARRGETSAICARGRNAGRLRARESRVASARAGETRGLCARWNRICARGNRVCARAASARERRLRDARRALLDGLLRAVNFLPPSSLRLSRGQRLWLLQQLTAAFRI